MTQLKGLSLAGGAQAHLPGSGGSVHLPCAHSNAGTQQQLCPAWRNHAAESVANLEREILTVQRET